MKKAERLLQIVTFLRSRRRAVTAGTLAERLNVSERTIYRDIQSLILSGVPVEGEAGVGYLLNADSSIAPLMFTETEIEALMLGARLVNGWGDDGMVTAADAALTKIRAVLPERTMLRLNQRATPFLVPDYARRQRVKFGDAIRAAMAQNKVLKLIYVDADENTTERQVEPLGLVFWGSVWTLLGWCLLRQDYRMFRLDRIDSLSETGQTFEIDTGHSLKAYLQRYDPDVDTAFWSS